MDRYRFTVVLFLYFSPILFLLGSCKSSHNNTTAFYYWKSSFQLNTKQSTLLRESANNTLYIHFFDVAWDDVAHKAYPNAVVNFNQSANLYHIIPVIYITNQTLAKINISAIDSFAIHCNQLLGKITSLNKINYTDIQFDCDWTISTKEKYFIFLNEFKKINRHSLQVTIRLHQVKYKGLTGVPPVDQGVLMFYNMGKPNTDDGESNSIYNAADAAKYLTYLASYPLKLDVALPLFSWALQIREGKVIQVYEKIKKEQLNNPAYFNQQGKSYIAKRSFFSEGIYIKESDIFKLEEIDAKRLKKAAGQLSESLAPQNNRTIIYYELANLDLSKFNTQTLLKVSAGF